MGPRYSSSIPRIVPFCITSTLPSRTKLRAASRVADMRLLQSTEMSPRLAIPRGISLGQHVFPTCLFWSRFIISCLSFSSNAVSKYLDFLFSVAVWFDGGSSTIFCFFDPLLLVALFRFIIDFDTDVPSTKKSSRILLDFPSSSKTTPSSSSKRLFF